MTFRGTYEHMVDDKGRVALPARYRHLFTEGVKLALSPDGCLEVYTPEAFAAKETELAATSANQLLGRRLRRAFSVRSWDAELDRQGRILIPPHLRDRAEIGQGPVVITGCTEWLEIWKPERWEAELAQSDELFGQHMEAAGRGR